MNFRRIIFVVLIMGLWAMTALAVSPEGGIKNTEKPQAIAQTSKAFGDPTDFKAAGMAGAQYILDMQSATDGGWDWTTFIFTHSGNNSPGNLYGVIANTLYELYLTDPTVDLWNAMTLAADWSVANGPNVGYDIDSSGDVVFLMNYASLPGVATPSIYQDAAKAILDSRKSENGGSVTDLCNFLYSGWSGSTGLAAWDAAGFCIGAKMLGDVYGAPYTTDAVEFANYFYNDSFNSPGTGWFEVEVVANDYDHYTIGVTGLIRMFQTTGLYPAELSTLFGLLLDCQYDDGGFNYKYGTVNGGASYQASAYAAMALAGSAGSHPAYSAAMYDTAVWFGTYQDASGGFVYNNGEHLPEIGAECTLALLLAADLASGNISASLPVGGDLLMCAEDNLMTFSLDINPATPVVIGFEIVVDITGDLPGTMTFAEATGLNADYFQVTGLGPYSVNGTFYLGGGIIADADLFTIFFDGLVEGSVDVAVVSYNLRGPGNVFIFGDVSGAGFVVDCTAPAAVTDITADPHHNRVEVGWTHDDVDVANYWIYHGVWYNGTPGVTAYPEYDDVGAIAPARVLVGGLPDPAQGWMQVNNAVNPGVDTFFDVFGGYPYDAHRGVFYYEVLAVDAAGNISPLAADNARATNYWLGDMTVSGGVTADGEVTALIDMTQLGLSFGESDGGANYNEFCDVGPTDDWSRVGVPTTDDNVNFEDLMVFSMNFGVVTGINKSGSTISPMAHLAWMEAGEGQYALRLIDGEGIKGIHVTAAATVNNVVAGQLLDAQNEMTFLKNIGSALDASVSVMGQNNGFSGYGDLLIINSSAVIDASDLTIEVRGYDNSVIQYTMESTSGSVVPREFSLNAAYPNPFNPMTKISFSLPETQDVTLKVYGIDGKLVATLVQDTFVAGLHEVIWNGQNDSGHVQASGLYFYRIQAGPYSQVQKMTLMK